MGKYIQKYNAIGLRKWSLLECLWKKIISKCSLSQITGGTWVYFIVTNILSAILWDQRKKIKSLQFKNLYKKVFYNVPVKNNYEVPTAAAVQFFAERIWLQYYAMSYKKDNNSVNELCCSHKRDKFNKIIPFLRDD